jgi:hypothetical protein
VHHPKHTASQSKGAANALRAACFAMWWASVTGSESSEVTAGREGVIPAVAVAKQTNTHTV